MPSTKLAGGFYKQAKTSPAEIGRVSLSSPGESIYSETVTRIGEKPVDVFVLSSFLIEAGGYKRGSGDHLQAVYPKAGSSLEGAGGKAGLPADCVSDLTLLKDGEIKRILCFQDLDGNGTLEHMIRKGVTSFRPTSLPRVCEDRPV